MKHHVKWLIHSAHWWKGRDPQSSGNKSKTKHMGPNQTHKSFMAKKMTEWWDIQQDGEKMASNHLSSKGLVSQI